MGFQQAWDGFNRFRDAAKSGEGIEGGVARAVCDAYAGRPDVVNAATNVTNPAFGIVAREGCKPYWDGPDGYTPPTEPGEGLPFEGGQCPGVPYTVFRTRTSTSTGQPIENDVGDYDGPVTISTPENPLNQVGDPLESLWVYTINEGRPDEQDFQTVSDGPPSFRLERVDGLPDDCGDPPATPIPSLPGSPPSGTGFGEPRDVAPPGSDPFVVTPRLPELGPDGPYFPIDTPFGTEPYDPTNPDARPKSEPPSVGPPIDVDGAGEVEADPEGDDTKPTLLGYRFEVRDNAPQFQSVIPGTSPRVYSRVVGSVQLVLRSGSGTFYSDNLQVTSQEGSIVKSHPTLDVVGCVYNVLPSLEGLTLYEIRGKDDDS